MMSRFANILISWYDKNKRDLPWRHTTDPYRIWISEIILQQTRVAQGYDYYMRFMENYPDVAEEVIRMYGYDHVISTFMPSAKVTTGGMNKRQKTTLKVKKALCSAGAYEGIHYSFFSPSDLDMLNLPADAPERHAIRLMNPINENNSGSWYDSRYGKKPEERYLRGPYL